MSADTAVTTEYRSPVYGALWRWHFLAAWVVVPLLLVLPVSGMLMLLRAPIEAVLYKDLYFVDAQGSALAPSRQLATALQQYPELQLQLWVPPRDEHTSSLFLFVPTGAAHHGGHDAGDAAGTAVFVNPYNGEVLGTLNPATTLYARVKALHGSLWLGDVGDALIEIAAGLAVLLMLSGLSMAWPRTGWRALLPRGSLTSRNDWRRLHGFAGLLVFAALLFFLLSGLAWTNVWGGRFTQAWSFLPGNDFQSAPNGATHVSLNHAGMHRVPWALEPTPLPASGSAATASTDATDAISLDTITELARTQGFGTFRISAPQDSTGVWTISATTMAGDVQDPRAERTLHIDQYTGQVLADLRFADYSPMGKVMAASIPFHQGDLGNWNRVLNFAICLTAVFMVTSGMILWWKRRPRGTFAATAPAADRHAWRSVCIAMLLVAICFPLTAMVVATTGALSAMYQYVKNSRQATK